MLFGTKNADVIDAQGGADIVVGLDGDDSLNGGLGNDILYGGLGADTLTGGGGNDRLFGESGGDTYVFHAGDGEAIIDDEHRVRNFGDGETVMDSDPNVLVFGEGIRSADLRFSELNGDLLIEIASSGDRVILRGYSPERATQSRSVDVFRFSDGSEIVAAGIELPGETIMGTDGHDRLHGTNRADTLIGGEGDDVLVGVGGNDRLLGGVGSDTYGIKQDYDRARVAETIIEEVWRAGDNNRLQIDGDVNPDDVRLAFDGRDLLLKLGDGGDTIRFAGFDPRVPGTPAPVSLMEFGSYGVTLDFSELMARGIRIVGTPDADTLPGTAQDDFIQGLEGGDALSGGAGSDTYLIESNGGVDTIFDLATDTEGNLLVLPDGISLSDISLSFDAPSGFLVIESPATGNTVRLSGFNPEYPLGPRAIERFRFGSGGDEISYEELLSRGFDIVGTPDNDQLSGSILQDRIYGSAGADLIDATPGGDFLSGGDGDDAFVVNLGDGEVTINDLATPGEGNVLRFGEGISAEALQSNLRFGDDGQGGFVLLLPYGDNGDVVRLPGFNAEDVENGGHALDRFEFADGTTVDYATLVSWTFVVEGDNSANALRGTSVGDRLYGYDDDDLLQAGDGNDVLTGGAGNDEMAGGNGRDTYVFNIDDGVDRIVDDINQGVGNIVNFGAGIEREDVVLELAGADLIVRYGNAGGEVRVLDYAPGGIDAATVIDTFEFADGSSVTVRELLNQSPDVGTGISDQETMEDSPFLLQLPTDLFVDGNGDVLTEWVSVSGYTQVPAWLNFDAATRTLYGTPENADVGEFSVTVRATDPFGASASYSFQVLVANINDAPEAVTLIPDQQAGENSVFSYALPTDAFTGVDIGDTLTYSASLDNDDPLPTWLGFDAATGTFSGTPGNEDVGTMRIRVTATDLDGASAAQLFNVLVANVNDPPTVSLAFDEQVVSEDEFFTYALPTDAFTDIDLDDVLTYSATLDNGDPLPTWLGFDAATGTFSGTPANEDIGGLPVRVTATDLAGASATQVFNVLVVNVNDTPTVSFALDEQVASEDALFTYTLPTDAFLDVDPGDVLSYSATLDNGDPLPIWLGFDAATGTFSGTPANENVGDLQVRVTVTDLAGASANQSFSLAVANMNDAPIVQGEHGQTNEDTAVSYTAASLLSNDHGVDPTHDVLAVSAVGDALHGTVSLSPAATVLFTPDANFNGEAGFSYTVADGRGGYAQASVIIDVVSVNDAPVASSPLSGQTARTGSAFAYTLPTNAFIDVDMGDRLSYSVTLADGNALPAWLKFNAATGVFSGTPSSGTANVQIKVVATDLAGASASQSFALNVTGGNAIPVVNPDSASVTEESQLTATGNVLTNDLDPEGVTLRVADSGTRRGDYGSLTLGAGGRYRYVLDNAASAVQSLGVGQTAFDNFTYRASDGVNATAGALAITIAGQNDLPVLAKALSDKQLAKNTDVIWKIPAGSFTDIDCNDTLSYSAKLANGSALPGWLKFDAKTQTFSGHVPTNAKDAIDIQVVASDGHGATATASDVFRVSFGTDNGRGKGNEGVGNGQDAPPPGHGSNWNDGAGTSPGHPGSSAGNSHNDEPANSHGKACDDEWSKSWGCQDKTKNLAYIDPKHFDDSHDAQCGDRGQYSQPSAANDGDFYHRWAEMDKTLGRMLAQSEGQPAWLDPAHGADPRMLGAIAQCGANPMRSAGVDPISLSAGADTCLKGFRGLQEGIGRLA